MSLPKVIFEEISTKINDIVQSNPAKDIEKNIKTILNSTFTKMDLVTQEEFEVQRKMLQKMANKIIELEQRIDKLEAVKPATRRNKKIE